MRYQVKRKIKLAIILGVIILAGFLYLYYGINLGLDLEGGSHIVLQAQPTEDKEIDSEVMNGVQRIIERRVDELGLTEPLIQRQGEDMVIVELPAVDNPQEAIETIGRTAVLTFRNQAGEVLMTGENITNAVGDYQDGAAVVRVEFNNEGAARMEEITTKYLNQEMGIYLDDEQLTNPTIQDVLRHNGIITGYQSIEEAQEHAILIREGSLPVPVDVVESRTVGPTLGKIAIQRSITAGLIGLLLVSLYVVFYYRFPGLLAAGVLIVYGILLMGVLAGLRATLTLPGIAGLILSIGMAIDANIIIFERIKDERKNGKTLKAAINNGFERALVTIIDANVTTLITAFILFYFTTGTVKGFAVTLMLGILVSMFTAFFVTKNIIYLFTGTELLQSESAFGAKRR